MITLHAIAASASVHPILEAISWQGEIAAVFHRSILCTACDGRLLHLHTGALLVSPFSLRIEGDFANVLCEVPLVRGMPVRKISSVLEIAEHVRVTLDDASYYQSPTHIGGIIAPDAINMAWQLLRANGRRDGFEKLPAAQTISTAIAQALADKNPAPMLEATRHLIGWGPGLTPSGDDVLVGCLRGLWLIGWNQPAMSEALDRLCHAVLPELNARTTRVGAEFIRYALEGAFAEILDQAALALVAAFHPAIVKSAVNRLLAQGETSGTDTMLGLLIGLEAHLSRLAREACHEGQDAPSILSTSSPTRR